MPVAFEGFGGGGKAKTAPAVTGRQQSESSTYFVNPDLAASLANLGGSNAATAAGQYFPLISDPYSSPLIQNALQGMFQSFQPQIEQGQVGLQDMFRGAGNTSSSTFGQAARGFQSDILRNLFSAGTDLTTQIFPQLVQALWQPQSQLPSLIDSLKLQDSTSQGEQYGFPPQTTGGGGGSGMTGFSYRGGGGVSHAPTLIPHYGASSPAPGGGGGSSGFNWGF